MKRSICQHCMRPEPACICQFCVAVHNQIKVVLLQHPKEQNHSKGTADLITHSLTDCDKIIDENFTDNSQLNQLLAEHPEQVYLLYPGQSANVIERNMSEVKVILLIDATWKKAFKMYSLSKNLQQLPCLVLPEGIVSRYRIRKTLKKEAFSTLEACSYALAILENNETKYSSLLENFEKFNDFQLSFRPSHHH